MSEKLGNALERLIVLEKECRDFGFDWTDQDMIIDYAISECEEVREAIHKNESAQRVQEEIGDLLLSAIGLCVFSGFDVGQTLERLNKKFGGRLEALKKITQEKGLTSLQGQSIEFMLELWGEVKKKEHL